MTTALSGGDLLTAPITCASDLSECDTALAACESSTCGNGELEAGEDCEVDWGSLTVFTTGSTCASEGFDAGSLACAAGCVYDTSGCRSQVCGDGFVDAPEQCDDGNVVNGDGCDSTCQNEAPPARFVDNGNGTITDNQQSRSSRMSGRDFVSRSSAILASRVAGSGHSAASLSNS